MGMMELKCPNCGANVELDETREFGFCNYCGTKVMQEKTVVEHKGSVKVDNSEYVEKFLLNARRAKQKEDWEETEKYYNLVEQNDPSNIEAIFYSAYGKAKMALIDDDIFKRKQVLKVLSNSISIIDDNYEIGKADEEEKAIKDIAKDINDFISSEFVFKQWKNGYGVVTKTDKAETFSQFKNIAISFDESIRNIIDINDQAYLHYILVDLYKTIRRLPYFTDKYKNKVGELLKNEYLILAEMDSNFEYKPVKKIKSDGCYVATAVYGSYDCPEVWTLRRYRDNQLAKTWYGRLFIHTYYAISPTLVKWFGNTQWFKNMWRPKLDCIVNELQKTGFESTPYEDKNW